MYLAVRLYFGCDCVTNPHPNPNLMDWDFSWLRHSPGCVCVWCVQKLLKAGDEDGGAVVSRSPSKSSVRLRPTSVSDAGRPHHRGGLHAGLISAPQNDLRHTLHVGYDGVVFGDLSEIGSDNSPSHVEATGVQAGSHCPCCCWQE